MINTIQTKKTKTLPKELSREISVLYDLGLEDYEVAYLVLLKFKRMAELKWKY